ncbi:hypothetical protein [Xenorhabdus vietnamensis]|nr:hypothetical protein [Xenorhabdus vietnamensis]
MDKTESNNIEDNNKDSNKAKNTNVESHEKAPENRTPAQPEKN